MYHWGKVNNYESIIKFSKYSQQKQSLIGLSSTGNTSVNYV